MSVAMVALAAAVVVCATVVPPLSVGGGGWAVDAPAAHTGVWPDGLREAVGADQAAGAYGVVVGVDGTRSATNPAQDLTARFSPLGVEVAPSTAGGTWRWSLALAGMGRAGAVAAVAEPEMGGEANRVEYRRGAITEWYINREEGIEQGFTLSRAPTGSDGPVVLELTTSGLVPRLVDGSVVLEDSSGETVLHYDGLHVTDATGRELPAHLRVGGAVIIIAVDDAAAAYPLTVDPMVWAQQRHLVAPDAGARDGFGYSVAVSGDTAVVGVPGDDTVAGPDAGSAYVYVRNGSRWYQQRHLFASHPGANDNFGHSVALSGETAVVAVPYDDTPAGTDAGSAYVYVRSGSAWYQQRHLFASDAGADERFGTSVALSGDTAVVGAPFDDTAAGADAGSAYVYVRSGPAWYQQRHLLASDAGVEDLFGYSVALSGETAVVGVPFDDTAAGVDAGSAYLYVRSGFAWYQQRHLFASDAGAGEWFGYSVALSGDTAVVGAPYDNTAAGTFAGSAYVYVRSGPAWYQQRHLLASDARAGAFDFFGASVALSGETVVVGAPYDDIEATVGDEGSAYVYVRSGTASP